MAVTAYKCPSCGAGIGFDAEKQKFVCEYCLSAYTEEEMAAQTEVAEPEEEVAEDSAAEDGAFCENMLSYTCESCGAEIFADKDTAAEFCVYCHNPVVCGGRLSGQWKPQKIVPFAYDKEQAQMKFLEFAKKKWFVPRGFFESAQVEKIRGIYYPFWLTDADVTAAASARAERVRTYRSGDYRITETQHYALYRKGNIHFEDVATGAYTGADKAMLEGILPYPTEALQEFSMPYLSGFFAKKRDVESGGVIGEVKARVSGYSEQMLRDTMQGYTSVHSVGSEVQYDKLHWDYALLPLWILTYKQGGKTYTYAMNGYTGKVYGEIPISGKKLFWLFLVFLGAAAILGLIGGMPL